MLSGDETGNEGDTKRAGQSNGENGKIKAKVTVILNKDNSVYTIVTQSPEENYEKYSDAFDVIHNTFQP